MLHIPFDCVDVHLGVRLQIITFHMSLLYAHLIPGGFLTDGLFCPGQRTCFFHTALCGESTNGRTCAMEDVMPRSIPNRGLYQLTVWLGKGEFGGWGGAGRGWLTIEVSWSQWKPAHSQPPLAHECTPACEAGFEKMPPALFFFFLWCNSSLGEYEGELTALSDVTWVWYSSQSWSVNLEPEIL